MTGEVIEARRAFDSVAKEAYERAKREHHLSLLQARDDQGRKSKPDPNVGPQNTAE